MVNKKMNIVKCEPHMWLIFGFSRALISVVSQPLCPVCFILFLFF